MSEILRPNYFQGQFLGAEDFEAEQRFHRDQQRRHGIGQHTWGIVAGLELQEREAGGGLIEVFVQPGMAIDGYGRELIVWRPTLVDVAQLVGLGPGLAGVWLVYDEEVARRSDLFCGNLAVYERTRQMARLVIEPDDPDSHSINVDGSDINPPGPSNEDDLVAPYDESVPYQEFPGGQPPWYVRLGSINWDGSKIKSTEAEGLFQDRRYAGSVAQQLLSPISTLRIADRLASPDETDSSFARLCAVVEGYLDVLRRLTTPQVGIGVEKSCEESTVAKLHVAGGSAITAAGAEPQEDQPSPPLPYAVIGPTEDGEHLMLDHEGAQVFADQEFAPGTLNLQVKGGDLAVNTDKLFVADSGNVGVGTAVPANPLHVKGDAPVVAIDGASGQAGPQLSLQVDEAQRARLYFDPAGTGRLRIEVNGDLALEIDDQQRVGIGTSPNERLEINGSIRGNQTNGALRINTAMGWTDIGAQDEFFSHINTEMPGFRFDKDIRVDTGMIGSQNNDLILKTGNDERIRVDLDSGNVGIGTPTPQTRLHVRGSIRLGSAGNLYALGAQQELRVVVGSASGGQGNESGLGYTVTRTDVGEYTIAFAPSFASAPVVLASSTNNDVDHIVTVRNVSSTGFRIEASDVGNNDGDPQNTSFSFIALGAP